MFDIIVIGGGTAGLTAAIYARRAAKTVLVIEAKACGGQIISTPSIENYPAAPGISGFDYATKLCGQAEALGAEFVYDRVTGLNDGDPKTVIGEKAEYTGRAVIIATGSENRKLGLPDEERLTGRGVSYCATCDGARFRGKTVAVSGGGNTALEDALYLSDLADTVYLIHRRDAFRADPSTVSLVLARGNVKPVLNSRVTGLVADRRLRAVRVTSAGGEETEIAVDGLFVAIGREPGNRFAEGLADLDQAGYVVAGEDCRTKTPGLFAAGDCRTKELRQLVTAAADGAVAADGASKYIASLAGA